MLFSCAFRPTINFKVGPLLTLFLNPLPEPPSDSTSQKLFLSSFRRLWPYRLLHNVLHVSHPYRAIPKAPCRKLILCVNASHQRGPLEPLLRGRVSQSKLPSLQRISRYKGVSQLVTTIVVWCGTIPSDHRPQRVDRKEYLKRNVWAWVIANGACAHQRAFSSGRACKHCGRNTVLPRQDQKPFPGIASDLCAGIADHWSHSQISGDLPITVH